MAKGNEPFDWKNQDSGRKGGKGGSAASSGGVVVKPTAKPGAKGK